MSIESPCIQLCQIDPERALCRGCGRTLQEIARWSAYSPAERRRIMNDLPARIKSTITRGAP
jgi:predicted Fe-S protein YdhL (DUF1289 family)